MVQKRCAWCGKMFPKEKKYIRKTQEGCFLIYLYYCPHCGKWTGIDYRMDIRAKMDLDINGRIRGYAYG